LRKRNADILTESFSNIPALRVTSPPDYIRRAFYKYYVFVRPEYLKVEWNRDRIIETLNARGIPCFSGSCSEIYREKAFEGSGLRPSTRLPIVKELGETSLMFLVHPTLSEQDIHRTAEAVHDVLSIASL
jgi:dTDP-4-amino-4,6-dideoxygalactose transaminase